MNDPKQDMMECIRKLERAIDPRAGFPEELFLFIGRVTPLVNVDLLIQDTNNGTLLTWRSDRFYGPGWHVPGGVVRYKEPTTERVHAVGQLELGVAVTFDNAPMLVTENINLAARDRAHGISLLYRCRLAGTLDPRRRYSPQSPSPNQWSWHERCPTNLIPEQRAYAALIG